jgi:hypothetical protein
VVPVRSLFRQRAVASVQGRAARFSQVSGREERCGKTGRIVVGAQPAVNLCDPLAVTGNIRDDDGQPRQASSSELTLSSEQLIYTSAAEIAHQFRMRDLADNGWLLQSCRDGVLDRFSR